MKNPFSVWVPFAHRGHVAWARDLCPTEPGSDGARLCAERFPASDGSLTMADSVYKIIELVGTSTESWEKAASAAIDRASQSLRDLRIAEVSELDLQLEGGQVVAYRVKVKVSFKFEGTD